VQPLQQVTGGEITLQPPLPVGKRVRAGLGYTSDLVPLPLTAQSDGAYGQSRTKNVVRCVLRVQDATRFKVGPSYERLVQTGEIPAGTLWPSGTVRVLVEGAFADTGQLVIRQDQPLPLTIVSLSLEVALGGG